MLFFGGGSSSLPSNDIFFVPFLTGYFNSSEYFLWFELFYGWGHSSILTKYATLESVKISARWHAYGYLLLNTLVWGAALVVVKPSLDVTSPYRFLFYRFAVASLLSLPILWHYWPKIKNTSKHICNITRIELIGTTFALSLLYAGLQQTSAIEAGLINNTLPLFVMLGGWWLLKEKIERHELGGMLVAFTGALLLTFFPYFQQINNGQHISVFGNILVLLSVASNLFYFPLAKRYYHRLPKLFAASVGFFVGLITFFLLSIVEMNFSLSQFWTAIQADWSVPSVWIATFYMAIFGSLIGLTAYIKGQDQIEASEAALFNYLQPLVYIPLGMVFLGEHVYPFQIVSMAIVLGGVVLAERRRSGRR